MTPRNILILLTVLIAMCLSAEAVFAETITTKDYFVLRDGTMTFTGSSQVVTTESAFSQCNLISESVFGVNYPGNPHRFFNYDSEGNLMFYGAYFGSEYIYIPPSGGVQWLPNELEIGSTYTSTWSRGEYAYSGCGSIGTGSDSLSITVTGPETVTVPAGTFKTYKLVYVDRWQSSQGATGVSTFTYWLAKDVGWVQMLIGGFTYKLMNHEGPPLTPAMTVTISGTKVTVSWTSVANADGYILFYAPYPYTGPNSILSVDMGAERSISVDLWHGAAFFLAVQAYNSIGSSDYSNIEYFIINIPSTAPTVTTESATSVTVSSAILNGTVNPNGSSTSYYFQYGATTSYGSTTTSTSAGSGSSNVSTSAPISSLVCNTAYHYRLVATSSTGTSYGSDKTFTTGTCTNGRLVPDTGQTQSYTDTFGEDSDHLINSPSYTKLDANGNPLSPSTTSWSMVKDNVTSLTWEVKTDDGSIHDKDNTYSWQDAQDVFIASLNVSNFGGYSDWRMPTIKELVSIANYGTIKPAIDTNYYPNTKYGSSYYWSSNIVVFYDAAWDLSYYSGGLGFSDKDDREYVRAVRGGQPNNSFIDNGDGTVTDATTRLMWQKDTAKETMPWEKALSYCEGLSLAGFTDWRLPNVKELQSIVDYEQYDPAIDIDHFPDTLYKVNYWTSTSFLNYISTDGTHPGWMFGFDDGRDSMYWKGFFVNVRAVRGGQ